MLVIITWHQPEIRRNYASNNKYKVYKLSGSRSRHTVLDSKIFRSMPLLLMNAAFLDNLEPVFYTSIISSTLGQTSLSI